MAIYGHGVLKRQMTFYVPSMSHFEEPDPTGYGLIAQAGWVISVRLGSSTTLKQ